MVSNFRVTECMVALLQRCLTVTRGISSVKPNTPPPDQRILSGGRSCILALLYFSSDTKYPAVDSVSGNYPTVKINNTKYTVTHP